MAADIVDWLKFLCSPNSEALPVDRRLTFFVSVGQEAAEEILKFRYSEALDRAVKKSIAQAADEAEARAEELQAEVEKLTAALYAIANIGVTSSAFRSCRKVRQAEDIARAALNHKDPS